MDEPTAYLSPRSVLDLLELLVQLNRSSNITIILIEHRLDLVIRPATRLIVIYEGEMVLDGDPRTELLKPLDKLYGLNIPAISKLCRELKSKIGLKITNPISDPKELAESLLEVLVK